MHLTMVLLLSPLVVAAAVTATRAPARRGRHRAVPRGRES
ncbi:hypothetical protein EDD38_7002 [Kitasatospora cineracea]|uniref:Uncharacterized protein n=1 Tax=Kitasatospora cineracea TaxID=88074 RepID=A0A3N4RUH0_9ACTN|nr:hypothetical protein EDD39_7285 [Kitasatospora cineracea]RPE27714.1 hypothetical protein EDD38_7002 [Kitasatospora cineracea]